MSTRSPYQTRWSISHLYPLSLSFCETRETYIGATMRSLAGFVLYLSHSHSRQLGIFVASNVRLLSRLISVTKYARLLAVSVFFA